MIDRCCLEKTFSDHGCPDFRWIDAQSIVVAQWVRMKCRFGCPGYGKSLSCPPHTPSVEECREFFREYRIAVLFRFSHRVDSPDDRFSWSAEVNSKLLKIEREVFLSGACKAFVMPVNECRFCTRCSENPGQCKAPKMVRPMPEAMAVDLFATVRSSGFPIDVLKDFGDTMNRYAILLVE